MKQLELPLGPVMGDVVGLELTPDDVRRLSHPLMGGVILFARNFANPAQLIALCQSIRAIRTPHLMIAVDHEGGRVQRFHEGFTTIPPMRELGRAYETDAARGVSLAVSIGYVIGAELAAHGLDFSFAPVFDLDWGESGVIGHRAFHKTHEVTTVLAGAVIAGLREAGMASVGKHYPGHGFVKADSHHEIPIDERSLVEIERDDMRPFIVLCGTNQVTGIMPAHVIYPKVDANPAGFSSVWLKDWLRAKIGFRGVIFSDDLSMEGASVAGGDLERANAALTAGCDMVLMCNEQVRCDALLDALSVQGITVSATGSRHLQQMHARAERATLADDVRYQQAAAAVRSMA